MYGISWAPEMQRISLRDCPLAIFTSVLNDMQPLAAKAFSGCQSFWEKFINKIPTEY